MNDTMQRLAAQTKDAAGEVRPPEDTQIPAELRRKLDVLKEYIAGLGSLAVGFSGGVDSTLLLTVAHEVLGDRAIAVTTTDAALPQRELKEAEEFCRQRGIRHITCTVDPMKNEDYRRNGPDRCYHCKKEVFLEIARIAKENGIEHTAEGSNMDDLGDYRPGLRAAEELGVTCPLRQAGLHKSEIRDLSKAMDLPTWDKPAYACLVTRLVYGEEITPEKLRRIEQAEQLLIDLGFREERVRLHGDLARIEVPPADIPRLVSDSVRESLYERMKALGFRFVTIDMGGYRMGSMNATIPRD